jgi:hypothetical protein
MPNRGRTTFFLWLGIAALCISAVALGRQQQTQADVSGKWHFVFQTQDGPREFDAAFQQDGSKITGKWDGDADVKGTFSDGKLSLEFPVNSSEVGPGTLKIDGELAEDALTGSWSFQTYDGTFKATRSKAG